MTPQESRAIVCKLVHHCMQNGMSWMELEHAAMYEVERFGPLEVKEALTQVVDRGELQHILYWVYDPIRRDR